MKCSQCGHALPEDSVFCQYCGSKALEKESAVEIQTPAIIAAPSSADQSAFDMDKIMNARDPMKEFMAQQAQETIRVMETNRTAQLNNEGDPEFGLVPEKPIYTLATDIVEGQRAYLGKLRTVNGEKITWNRRGSISVDGVHGMIDIYETFLPSGQSYKTLYINMYGAKKSVVAPNGFIMSELPAKSPVKATPAPAPARTAVTSATTVQKKAAPQKTASRAGWWVALCLLAVALCISLFFIFSQHSNVVALQNQVAELQKIEENSNNYKALLKAMENVNGANYKQIGTLLDKLPTGYEDISKIRTQYNELKKYITAIESSTLTTRPCDAFRTAYVNLLSFNNKYHNWDISNYVKNDIYKNHFKKFVFGREWTDSTNKLHWYEDNDGQRLSTNLPNDKKSWLDYYFTTSGYGTNFVIGYENTNDSKDEFDAFKIVDVIYSNGAWSISVYCYSNERTYTLK